MTHYVVSIRRSGLGDRLVSLSGAWLFARNTGRTLVVDWRFGAYSGGSSKNIFGSCFQVPAHFAGVPFLLRDSSASIEFPPPRHPPVWNDDGLMHCPFRRPISSVLADRDEAVSLIRSGADVDSPTVVFDGCVDDGLELFQDGRAFFESLHPTPALCERRNTFRDRYFGNGPAIGLHVRHGNGGDVGDHSRYWQSFSTSLDRCRAAIDFARRELASEAPIFLCTDSVDVDRAISCTVGNVVRRPKDFLSSGDGELHLGPGSARTLHDALTEMLLLSDCAVLIRYPPGSFFSLYGAVMKPARRTTPHMLLDLQRPYSSEDPLSPAVLF